MLGNNIYKGIIKIYKNSLIFYYFILLVCFVIMFYFPISLSDYINICIRTGNILNGKLFFLCILIVLELLFKSIKDYLNICLSNKITFKLEQEVSDYLIHADYMQIKAYDDVYLAQRLNNDSVVIGDYVCEKLPYFAVNIITIIVICFYVFWANTNLGCIFILFLVFHLSLYFLTKRSLFKRAEKMFEAQADFFSMLGNQFNSILMIKIYSLYKEKNAEFKSVVRNFYSKSLSYLRLELIIKNFGDFSSRALLVFAVFITVFKMSNNTITVGLLTSLVLYIEILIEKINEAIVFGDAFQKYNLAQKRIYELKSFDVEHNGEITLQSLENVIVEDVIASFGENYITYPQIRMKKNRIYLLKGDNGAGKSTLIKLLLGIVYPQAGKILYNSIEIENINLMNLRRKLVAVKTQEPFIINGNLKENLEYGIDREIKDNEILLNNFLDFINDDLKEDKILKSKNINISGGEQQRIAISRAIFKDADLLILDEPTNALDEKAKEELVNSLLKLTNKIVLVISHDKCFDKIADEIIYL
jgi:ATP-binding cassette subfamily C protein